MVVIASESESDSKRISDCLNNSNLKCTFELIGNNALDNTFVKYVIYGFNYELDEISLKNNILKQEDRTAINCESLVIDKLINQNGAAAIIKFKGKEACDAISEDPHIYLDFSKKLLIKYQPILMCEISFFRSH